MEKLLMVFVVLATLALSGGSASCCIKGIFNFGDSNTDTGGYFAAFPPQKPPYGMTFFHKPTGRATDGRVLLDFLAQAMGIPYLSPYLKSIGADFKHGANYATAASMVLQTNISIILQTLPNPFNLGVQLDQMKQFRSSVLELGSSSTTPLPSEDMFGRALYTMYIGQNDIAGCLIYKGMRSAKQIIPLLLSNIDSAIKEVYGVGGRTIWVLNLAPIGCYPSTLVTFPHESSDLDQYGCIISANNLVRDYNNMLKEAVTRTRAALPGDASIIYVDTHSVLLHIFHHPTFYGMKYGTKACCGQGGEPYNYNPSLPCGETSTTLVNGSTLTATACKDPSKYVSWDGVHTTEVTNKLVTLAILNGSLFDPRFPLQRFCDLHPIT